ncbi:MAG: hypothetical protein ACT4RN_23300 [Pseudonocardia sp.]
MLTLIWSVTTPVLVLLGALALERMQRRLLEGAAAPPTRGPSAPPGR